MNQNLVERTFPFLYADLHVNKPAGDTVITTPLVTGKPGFSLKLLRFSDGKCHQFKQNTNLQVNED